MSPIAFIILILVAIVLLSVMTLKLKMHPVITLFIVAVVIGLASGYGFTETTGLIKTYFGSTLSSIGILIIFGAIIASGINDTGAATSIVNFFIRLFKGKNLELAPALTGFIMSIPVFGDIAIVLNAPIAAILSKRKNLSMTVIAPIINLGLTLTHGLVPPTPGILAVSVVMGADLGKVIIWGLLCSVISFAATYFIMKPILKRGEFIEPLADYTEGIEPVADDAPIEDMLIVEENVPSAGMAFLPLLLPAVMIAVGSIGNIFFEDGSVAKVVLNTIGDSVLALFVGIIAVGCLVFKRRDKVIAKANEQANNLTSKSGWFQIVFDNWVGRALKVAIGALMITAMGGAMGGILRENSAIQAIGDIVAESSFPALLVPFILAAVLMAVCGSMTTAAMTAAALVAGMLPALGLSPVVATLAIGAGSMCFWHVNNSGFWIFCSLYNFNAKQGLKYFTTTNAMGGLTAFIALCIFSSLGFIA